jgi:hypothetical protein
VNNKIEKQYDYRAAFLVVDGVYNSELTAPFDSLPYGKGNPNIDHCSNKRCNDHF